MLDYENVFVRIRLKGWNIRVGLDYSCRSYSGKA